MPIEIKLEQLPAGYAVHGANSGQVVNVRVREFTSSEDGQLFISRLEGTPTKILEQISCSPNSAAAMTSSLLAVIRPDRSATVYHNEFIPKIVMRAKRKVESGEAVMLDDILQLDRVV